MHSAHAAQPEDHHSKKRFQPSITTYFALSDGSNHDDYDLRGLSLDPPTRPRPHHHHHHHNNNNRATAPHRPRASLAPPLPGQVQAELLNVGMRVRKAVPEGYKAQKLMSGLPSITTTLVNKPTTTLDVKSSVDAASSGYAHQRELLPFCGLDNATGYAEQPTTNIHLYGSLDSRGQYPTDVFPLSPEAFTQPFSSQGSADSGYMTSSQRLPNPLNPSKRAWHDDNEVRTLTTDVFFSAPRAGVSAQVDEVPISPLSETPPNMLPQVRQFAQPKSRRPGQRSLSIDEDIDMDFGTATQCDGRVAVGERSDFEEADFLAREVHMDGV